MLGLARQDSSPRQPFTSTGGTCRHRHVASGSVVVAVFASVLAFASPGTSHADGPRIHDRLGIERPSRAEVPAGPSPSTRAEATDPTGDTFGGPGTQIDLTRLKAEQDGGDVLVTATFSAAVEPPSSPSADALDGFLDIDADQDGTTGNVPFVDVLSGSPDSGMGNEYYVELFTYSTLDSAADLIDDSNDQPVARVPVSFNGDTMTIRLPIAILGDPAIDVALVVGTLDGFTDKAPNQGSVASDVGTGGPAALLRNGRFRVEVAWRFPPNFPLGPAFVSDIGTDDSALFYFRNPDNLEFLIKVLDGCPLNDHFWVFFAGATTVEFTVTVTDTQSQEVVTYFNPLGQRADAVTDTEAFATCP